MENNFKWNDETAKQFCEFVGLRVKANIDIRQEINLLCEDFKNLNSNKSESWKDSILEFKSNKLDVKYIHDSQLKDTFCLVNGEAPFFSFDEIMKTNDFHISKVKNESGIEFSVGDTVSFGIYYTGIIKQFVLRDNVILTIFTDAITQIGINHLIKAEERKPLFQIQNKDVFDGDEYWVVSDDDFQMKNLIANNYSMLFEWAKYFLTKESAEQFIRNNTKNISIADLENYFETHYFIYSDRKAILRDTIIKHFKENS